jgi:hypothetical protein
MPRKRQQKPRKQQPKHKQSAVLGDTAWSDMLLLIADIFFKAVPVLHTEVAMSAPNSQTVNMSLTWPLPRKQIPMLMLSCKQFYLAYRQYNHKQYEYGCWVLQRFWNSVVSTATIVLKHTEGTHATVFLQCGDTVLCEVRIDQSGVHNGVLQVRHSYTKFEELAFDVDVLYDIDYDSLRERLFTIYFESKKRTPKNKHTNEFHPRGALRDRLRLAIESDTEFEVEPRPVRTLAFNRSSVMLNGA